MSILADYEITELAWPNGVALPNGMITPFQEQPSPKGEISYGISSYGYDARIGNKFKVFDSWLKMHKGCIDPKSKDWHNCFTEHFIEDHQTLLIPPNSFALGETVELFDIPRDVICVCLGKSTLARCGIIVNITPLEPEWIGKITIEISNTSPLPAKIYAGEGICQVLFFRGNPCHVSYADKQGVYQNQEGLTLPKVKGE